MVLKLYGNRFSTCTQRVLITLAEKKVDAELIIIDLSKGEQKAEKYINELHPFGRVPVLVDTDSGIQIFESRAIAQYIATKHRSHNPNLLPSDTDLRSYAYYQQALSIEQSYFDPAVSTIAFETYFKKNLGLGPANPTIVKTQLGRLEGTLEGYNRILSKQKYLAGNEVTLVDLFHLPYGTIVEPLGFGDLLEKFPAVSKWWSQLKTRESWNSLTKIPI